MTTWKVLFLAGLMILTIKTPTFAEVYVAGQVGANFPQDFTDVRGVGSASGVTVSDLDLKNQVVFGIKFGGYFPGSWNWLGLEAEYYHTDHDIKGQAATLSGPIPALATGGQVPKIDIIADTFALNGLVRYPGEHFQPYVGVGVGINVLQIDANAGTSGTRVEPTLNLLAGIRVFMTEHIGAFIEYKHNRGSVKFPDVGFKADFATNMALAGVSYHWK